MSKRRMGSIDYTPIILLGGVGIAAYLLVKNGFFSSGNAINNQQLTTSNATGVNTAIATAAASGDKQINNSQALASLANNIYNIGIANQSSDGTLDSTDQDTIVNDIIGTAESLTDLLLVIQYFGTKNIGTHWYSVCQSLGIGCTAVDLPTFLKIILDSSHMQELNQELTAYGINYQFSS